MMRLGVLQSNSKTPGCGYDANGFLTQGKLACFGLRVIITINTRLRCSVRHEQHTAGLLQKLMDSGLRKLDGNDMDQVTFDQTYELAEILINKATKEQLAECARLLALNLAHHQIKHGEIPVDQTLALLRTFERSEEHLNLLIEGMLNLIGVLMNVCAGVGQSKH